MKDYIKRLTRSDSTQMLVLTAKYGFKNLMEKMNNYSRGNKKKYEVCMKCGAINEHSTVDCNSEIPSIDFLENQMNIRLDFVLSQVPQEWQKDEFGYFIPEIESYHIPDDQPNCINCGEFGHSSDECIKPNKDQIHSILSTKIKDGEPHANDRKKELLESIIRGGSN